MSTTGLTAQDNHTTASTSIHCKALIVANRQYQNLPPVNTANNDALLIAPALQSVGFKVTIESDLTEALAKTKIETFIESANPSDLVLIYFTGHGAQEEGENYLIPTDFDPKGSHEDIAFHAYSVSRLLFNLEKRRPEGKIIVLDACREVPGYWAKKGLASVTPGARTQIAFACASSTTMPDQTAASTGLFARSFVEALQQPGLTISKLFDSVRSAVADASGRRPFALESDVANLRFCDAPLPTPTIVVVEKEKLVIPTGPQINVPKENGIDKQFYVWAPAGKYQMGCVSSDTHCQKDELPRHPVQISKGFWIGSTEVSVATYSRYVKLNRLKMPASPPSNNGWKHGELPMVNINWPAAAAFCSWAGGRLPTEAEWEYAARAGLNDTLYPWGNDISHNQAKYNAPIRSRKISQDLWDEMAPVKSFDANPWGLYDVVGNVREWCSDWYQDKYDNGATIDPKGPSAGTDRVLRSGSFGSPDDGVRLSKRYHWKPQQGFNQDGFRCVVNNDKLTH